MCTSVYKHAMSQCHLLTARHSCSHAPAVSEPPLLTAWAHLRLGMLCPSTATWWHRQNCSRACHVPGLILRILCANAVAWWHGVPYLHQCHHTLVQAHLLMTLPCNSSDIQQHRQACCHNSDVQAPPHGCMAFCSVSLSFPKAAMW